MARGKNILAVETGGGSNSGRLNNKADLDDDEDLLGCARRLTQSQQGRMKKIGKNSTCQRRQQSGRSTRSMLQQVSFSSGTGSTSKCGRPYTKMIMLPIYLGLLSQLGIFVGGVEGNGEIESCVVQTRSSSATGGVSSAGSATSAGGTNGFGYYPGSSSVQNNGVGSSGISGAGASGSSGVSGLLGGGGNINNNNNEPSAAALVDPHSVVFCQIRTLHSDLDMENLTSSISSGGRGGTATVDMSSITRLKLVCNDVLFFESDVSSGQFRSLSELHELNIDKCKLTKLPDGFLSGLRHLRKLTINTGNSEWAARSLELEPLVMTDVPQLRHLHLGFNHMWNLPGGLLCNLGSLQSLNLTNNLLSDVEDLGLPGRPPLGSVNNDQSSTQIVSSTRDSNGGSRTTSTSLSCLSELKSLDLSFNSLRSLGSRRLEFLKRLQELKLDHNWLEELEDDSLHGLAQLRTLNLSSNRLVALPSKLFLPSNLLRELDLHNNSLASLSPGVLSLEYLQTLDLSMNSLSSQYFTAEAFKSLVRLVILNLSFNQLTHLAPSMFQDLFALQVLDLSSNLISSISDDTFAPLSNLHSLILSKNRLVTLNSNMFTNLHVLHKLILDYNEVTTIQTGAMNFTSLQDLSMQGNHLTNVPALTGLKMLRTLDVGENKISNLNSESFQGMSELIGLRLVSNSLTELPPGFCESMKKLRVLNVANNRINKISSLKCPELRVLRLDSNHLQEIPNLAPLLPNLLWLNISKNSILRMDLNLLPPTLEWLDVSHNKLEALGGAWSNFNNPLSPALGGGSINSSTGLAASENDEDKNFLLNNGKGNQNGLNLPRTGQSSHQHNSRSHHSHHHPHQFFSDHPNAKLRIIDASFNKLQIIDFHAIPPNLEVIRLSHNFLKRIVADTFAHASNLRRVELIGNQLEHLPLSAIRLSPIPPGVARTTEFFLGGNPFLCDCEMEWLTRINQLSASRQHQKIVDIDAIVCRLAYSRSVTHIPLPDIKPQDFLCHYKAHCFHLCQCCEFDACDCAMLCPEKCECYHDSSWSAANVINCARSGHMAIPSRLPMDATHVYLDGNNMSSLKSHSFIGRKNLKILHLNSSNIDVIHNKSFNGLQSLLVLNMAYNRIKVLHGYEFDQLFRLRELYLNDNLIETINNTTFLPLKSLEILRLQGNRIVSFSVWQLSLNSYLTEIGLANNYWNCDCAFLHQLYGWVSDNSRKVVDLVQLQCVWNTTHKPGPHLIDYNRTCGSSWALMGIENGLDFTTLSPLPLALAFVSLLTLLILVIALVIICRENFSLWLFNRFNGFRLCGTVDYEDDKSYDSYLIYSLKDEEFVAQRIADELETNDNFRLCLHYRDLMTSDSDVRDMMMSAIHQSKSVIIILSRNFLQGEWSSGENRNTFNAVLKRSTRSGGGGGGSKIPPKKILIVFIEDIPKMEINPDIRAWVRHNRIKVIKWNIHSTDYGKNRKFWNKLKYLLPDPSSHYHSNITSNTTTTSASSNEGRGGIMATLKYSTTMQGDSHLHHQIAHPNHNNMQPTHPHLHPHQQIIVDESGRFTTTTNGGLPPQISSSQTNTLNSIKYWPYGATNFVALPPKYQTSHHSSSGGSHPPSVNSPGSAQSLHYHPPLPLTNPPPRSPPSSQSTDSTTTTMADDVPSLMSQLTMASFHSASVSNGPSSGNHVSATKSPVPVPKSSYSSSPRNNISTNSIVNSPIMIANNASNSSGSNSTSNNLVCGDGSVNNGMGGESYLSIEGEHVYSTLDPPSPQPVPQSMSLMSQNILGNGTGTNFLNNIHLPNGYTYQPQSSLNHHHHHPQQPWLSSGANHHPHHVTSSSHQQSNNTGGGAGKHHHPHQAVSSFVGSSPSGGGGPKSFKQKDTNNPVQTYLV